MNVKSMNVRRIFIAFLIIAILFSVASVSANPGPKIDFKKLSKACGEPVDRLNIDLIRSDIIPNDQLPVRFEPNSNEDKPYKGIPICFVYADPVPDGRLIGYTPISSGDISIEQVHDVSLNYIHLAVSVPYYHIQIDNQMVNFISINDVQEGYMPIGYEPYYQ